MTPARFRWLQRLEKVAFEARGRGDVARCAMSAGLTEWVYRRNTDNEIMPPGFGATRADWSQFSVIGERLTQAGRDALAQARVRKIARTVTSHNEARA